MESENDYSEGTVKKEYDNCLELAKVEVDFKHEHFGDSHIFELERRHSLANNAYWLIGILIVLFGAVGYIWTNRVSAVLFIVLMFCLVSLCLVALAIAIYVAWPVEYITLDKSEVWNKYWDDLLEHYKDYDDWEKNTYFSFRRAIINQFIEMEAKNIEINDSRERWWMRANKIVIMILVLVLVGFCWVHFSEVKEVFVKEVNTCEQVETATTITTTTTTTTTTSEEH